MRACTAVVTELSWNSSDDPTKKYRAEIEFIKASDWQKDLEVSLNELIDGSGNVAYTVYICMLLLTQYTDLQRLHQRGVRGWRGIC